MPEAGTFKIKAPAWSHSGESPLPGSQPGPSHCVCTGQKDLGTLRNLLLYGMPLIHGGPGDWGMQLFFILARRLVVFWHSSGADQDTGRCPCGCSDAPTSQAAPRIAGKHWKPEVRGGPPLGPSRERGPAHSWISGIAPPGPSVSVVLSHLVCGSLLWQPRETSARASLRKPSEGFLGQTPDFLHHFFVVSSSRLPFV